MMKTQAPVTVLYCGDVRDTAILVGLVHAKIPIGLIAYTGPIEECTLEYLRKINLWLEGKGIPPILIHPNLSNEQLQRSPLSPLQEWGWSLEECRLAIKLAGLPPPTNERFIDGKSKRF